MANMLQGQADFTDSSGKVWHLTLDFYAFAVAARSLSGGDLDALFEKLRNGADIIDMGHLLHGALLRRHPEITHPDAVNLLGDSVRALDALNSAIIGSMPANDDASAEGKGVAGGIGMERSGDGPK